MDVDNLMVSQGRIPAQIQHQLVETHPDALSTNPWLEEDVWWKLYTRNIPGERAESLAHRVLDTNRIDHIIAREHRARPLLAILGYNTLSTAQQQTILAKKRLGSSVPGYLARFSFFDETLFEEASARMHGMFRLSSLMERQVNMSDDAVAEELGAIETWWGSDRDIAGRNEALSVLFAVRPGVLSRLIGVNMPEVFRQPMAGCRNLTCQSWQYAVLGIDATGTIEDAESKNFSTLEISLVWNPYTTREVIEYLARNGQSETRTAANKRLAMRREPLQVPYEELEDPDQLGWAISRSCSKRYEREGRIKPARPVDLCALAHNARINTYQAEMIAADLRAAIHANPFQMESVLPRHIVVAAFQALGEGFEADALAASTSAAFEPRTRFRPQDSWMRQQLAEYVKRVEALTLDAETTRRIEEYRVDEWTRYMSNDQVGESVELLAATLTEEQFVLMLKMAARHKGTIRQLRESVQRLAPTR